MNYYLNKVSKALESIFWQDVTIAAESLRSLESTNGVCWLVGNGGSASTASHFSNDLLKMAGLRCVCLPDMTATTLAYGNDTGWENMFSGPMKASFRKWDILVAISCSGRSRNVLQAAKYAMNHGGKLIVLTGTRKNNSLAKMVYGKTDAIFFIASDDIRVQEDCHLAICHAIIGELLPDVKML